jgi:hypothetical protein
MNCVKVNVNSFVFVIIKLKKKQFHLIGKIYDAQLLKKLRLAWKQKFLNQVLVGNLWISSNQFLRGK